VYYGSTTQRLSKRLNEHKQKYKIWCNNKYSYVTSFELFKIGDPIITLVERYPCDDKESLIARERFYIENNTCVNKIIPGRTDAEWRQVNRETLLERHTQYYQTNHETILEQKAQYYQDNKEILNANHTCCCGGKYTHKHKSRHIKTNKHQSYLSTLRASED
jgi:hypothetical protein